MNFICGFGETIFYSRTAEGQTVGTYLFSFYNEGLIEYDEDIYCEEEIIDGSVEEKYLYTKKEFEILLDQLMISSDAMLLQHLYDDERAGLKIFIQPNAENNQRVFPVVSVKEKRKLEKYPGKENSFGNKYGPTKWKTCKPIYFGDWTLADVSNFAEEFETVCVTST